MLGKSVAPAVHHRGAARAMRACLRSVGASAAAGTMQLNGLVWPSVGSSLASRSLLPFLGGRQWGLVSQPHGCMSVAAGAGSQPTSSLGSIARDDSDKVVSLARQALLPTSDAPVGQLVPAPGEKQSTTRLEKWRIFLSSSW